MVLFSCNVVSEDKAFITLSKGEGIHAAFYNSDGSKIAMATTSGRLLLCDNRLNIISSVQAHEHVTNSSFFSLNDSFIVTGGDDNKINVWSAFDLASIKTYPFIMNSHTTVLGYSTMVGCGNRVVVYNKQNEDTFSINLNSTAFHVYYNKPDTSVLVSAGNSGYEINLIQKKVTHQYTSSSNLVYCIMPDQSNKTVVLACSDSIVRVFNSQNQRLLYQSKKLDGAVYVACYNYHNNTIAASTSSGSIYLFDVTLKNELKKIKAFEGCINTIHFHPSDSFLVVGSLDKKQGGAKLFDIQNAIELKSLLTN